MTKVIFVWEVLIYRLLLCDINNVWTTTLIFQIELTCFNSFFVLLVTWVVFSLTFLWFRECCYSRLKWYCFKRGRRREAWQMISSKTLHEQFRSGYICSWQDYVSRRRRNCREQFQLRNNFLPSTLLLTTNFYQIIMK